MLIWSKNKTFFQKKKKKMVHNFWFIKQKFYYGTAKKLECTSLIHNIKVQMAKIPGDYVFWSKWEGHTNNRITWTALLNSTSFIHSLIQLPLPSTELCRRNVKMIKLCLCPQKVCNLFTERSQLRKTPEQWAIWNLYMEFNRNVCTEGRRNTEECLDWKVRKRKDVRGSWFSSPGHEEENLESDPKKLWQEVRKTRRSHFNYPHSSFILSPSSG